MERGEEYTNERGRRAVVCVTCGKHVELRGYRMHHMSAHQSMPPSPSRPADDAAQLAPEPEPASAEPARTNGLAEEFGL